MKRFIFTFNILDTVSLEKVSTMVDYFSVNNDFCVGGIGRIKINSAELQKSASFDVSLTQYVVKEHKETFNEKVSAVFILSTALETFFGEKFETLVKEKFISEEIS